MCVSLLFLTCAALAEVVVQANVGVSAPLFLFDNNLPLWIFLEVDILIHEMKINTIQLTSDESELLLNFEVFLSIRPVQSKSTTH